LDLTCNINILAVQQMINFMDIITLNIWIVIYMLQVKIIFGLFFF